MIYFIQNNGDLLIKIGFTDRSAESRQQDGATWAGHGLTILATMPGDRSKESALHRQFNAARVSPDREWFRPVPDLILYIMGIVKEEARQRERQVAEVLAVPHIADLLQCEQTSDEGSVFSMKCPSCCSFSIVGINSVKFDVKNNTAEISFFCKEGCDSRFIFCKNEALWGLELKIQSVEPEKALSVEDFDSFWEEPPHA